MFMRKIIVIALIGWLAGCADENEHFCARYEYLYTQLETGKDLPSYSEMKQALLADMADPGKKTDQAKFMLFVLEDYHSEFKPYGESARDFCLRIKRWEQYR